MSFTSWASTLISNPSGRTLSTQRLPPPAAFMRRGMRRASGFWLLLPVYDFRSQRGVTRRGGGGGRRGETRGQMG